MENGNQKIPDGQYDGQLLSLDFERDRSANTIVLWNIKVMGGRYDGAMPPKQHCLKTTAAWNSLVREAGILGIVIHDMRDLESKRAHFAGITMRFAAKTSPDGFQVIRIVKLLQAGNRATHGEENETPTGTNT